MKSFQSCTGVKTQRVTRRTECAIVTQCQRKFRAVCIVNLDVQVIETCDPTRPFGFAVEAELLRELFRFSREEEVQTVHR